MRHRAATHSALAGLLAAWFPAQRWFAGSAGQVSAVRITSDVPLADGEPELRHLMAHVTVGGASVAYQVMLGIRSSLPDELAGAAIGTLPDGRICYDAAADPELTAVLLDAISARRTAGPVRFAAVPGAVVEPGLAARTLPAATSNTSVVFGDRAILKLLRRPFAGHHPDLEIPAALAAAGSALVAPPLGWIELAGAYGGDAEHSGPARCARHRLRSSSQPRPTAGRWPWPACTPTRRTSHRRRASSARPPPGCTPSSPRRSAPGS